VERLANDLLCVSSRGGEVVITLNAHRLALAVLSAGVLGIPWAAYGQPENFSGNAADETVSYGGLPYCNYTRSFTGTVISLKVNLAAGIVENGHVSTYEEEAAPDCPYPPTPPDTFVFTVASGSVNGGQVSASFSIPNSDQLATFAGTITGSSLSGTLTISRGDDYGLDLYFSLSVPAQLALSTLAISPSFAIINATAGSGYTSGSFVASGGAPPYIWSASGLPTGLTLVSAGSEASIQGTPVAPSEESSLDVEGELFQYYSPTAGSLTVIDQTGATVASFLMTSVQFDPYVPLPETTKAASASAGLAKSIAGAGIALGVVLCEAVPACAPEGTVLSPVISQIDGVLMGSAIGDILQALDPPDSNFTVIATPKQISAPAIQSGSGISAELAAALNNWLSNGLSELSLQLALVTSLNRASGAVVARNSVWQSNQLQAAKLYALQLSALLSQEGPLRQAAASGLAGTSLNITLDPQSINRGLAQIADVGFRSDEASVLNNGGIGQDELSLLQEMISNPNSTFGETDLAGTFTDPGTIAALMQEAGSYGAFGAGASPTITGVYGAALSVPKVTQLTTGGLFTVFGSNFALPGVAHALSSSDLVNNALPTNMVSTCVQVGSVLAPLTYVSSTQINAQAPTLPSSGSVQISVIVNCGTANQVVSQATTASVAASAPEFLYFSVTSNGPDPVVAVEALSGAYVGPPGLIAGASFAPAEPGDTLTVYGVGFGATASLVSPGAVDDTADSTAGTATVTIGGIPATVLYAGLTPGDAGLYQVNLVVPQGIQSGNQPIVLEVNGGTSPSGAYLAIAAPPGP
jgi:uncharacterized protein (TIGR03437 family)